MQCSKSSYSIACLSSGKRISSYLSSTSRCKG